MRSRHAVHAVIAFTALIALTAQTARTAHAQATHALVATGVSGEPRLAQQFARDGAAIRDAIGRRFGGHATLLTEKSSPRSDRAGLAQAFERLATTSRPGDRVLVVLIGHGSATGGEPRFNIPGPDITARDLALHLERLEGRHVAVVVATSASGAFLPALSAPGRAVLTATRSAAENEEVRFAEFFARALTDDVADIDKDGGVSLAEAFEFARREVERFYKQHNRLATEHALLDDDGDGKGSLALDREGDGRLAREFVLRAANAKAADPGMRALIAQQQDLQQRIEALKARKASLAPADYDAQLEKLLLELARTNQRIQAGGGKE